MRTPTPIAPLYAWHRAALAGAKPQITTEPQCGWFKRRLVKGGPFVAARIWLHQEIDPDTGELIAPEELLCEVNGKPADPVDQWLYLADQPITEPEYRFLLADAEWLKRHAPSAPEANPQTPISTRNIPTLF